MKRSMLVSLLISGLLLLAAPRPARAGVTVSIGFFHDELSPYGRWAPCAYGECWVPTGVAAGWQPYSNGEWIYTDFGWTWASDDPWGGDPYHYGSWVWLDDDDDWGWVPGTIWAPAWVTWCYSDEYVGWAPLSPNFTLTASGYFGSPVIDPARSYVFVPTTRFVGVNTSTVRLPAVRNATILQRTRPATAFSVSGGTVRNTAISPSRIERATGKPVSRRSIAAARTDPRPVPRMAANGPLRLAAPAKTLRSQIANQSAAAGKRGAARRPSARTSGKSVTSVKRSPPTRSHPPSARQPIRRPAQPTARHGAQHRSAAGSSKTASRHSESASRLSPRASEPARTSARSVKTEPSVRASAHKPARSKLPTAFQPARKPSAGSARSVARSAPRREPPPRPALKPVSRPAPAPAPRATAASHPRPAPPARAEGKKKPEKPS